MVENQENGAANDNETKENGNKWTERYSISIISLIFFTSLYLLFVQQTANGLFGLIVTALTIFTQTRASEYSPYQIVSAPFRYSDKISRKLVIISAILGSALVLDTIYPPISFLIWPLDTTLKRLTVPILIFNLCIFVSSLMRKAGYFEIESRPLTFYRTSFYCASLVLFFSTLVYFLGLPVETYEIFGDAARSEPELLVYSEELAVIKAFAAASLISLIWIVSSLLCLVQFHLR